MRAEQARQNMMFRILHMDADGDNEEEETEEAIPEVKGGANTRLPYGLCKRFNISLPDKATPHEAWEALEGKGVHAREAFAYLKQHGTIEGFEPKIEQSKIESSKSRQNKSESSMSEQSKEDPHIKKKVVEFTPAKTIKEAEDYARKTFGVKRVVYDGLDIEVANTYNEILTSTFKKAPKLAGVIKILGNSDRFNEDYKKESFPVFLNVAASLAAKLPQLKGAPQSIIKAVAQKVALTMASTTLLLGPNTIACYVHPTNDFNPIFTDEEKSKLSQLNDRYVGLLINPSVNKSKAALEAELAYNVAIGYFPQGCGTIKSNVDHELAHGLDVAYGLSSNEDILAYFNALTACKPNDKDAIMVPGSAKKMDFAKIKSGLSGYAAERMKDNKERTKEDYLAEFIAEAWSEYRNNKHPREIAAKVGKIIEGIIRNDGTGIY